jgi:hypothetical protein
MLEHIQHDRRRELRLFRIEHVELEDIHAGVGGKPAFEIRAKLRVALGKVIRDTPPASQRSA